MRLPFLLLIGALIATGYARADNLTPGPVPDPSHIPFTLPKDIKWQGDEKAGVLHARLFGDPDKPGIYGELIKWLPGHFSKPHFHSTDRFAYVISGTWWVSSSNKFDPDQTYPMPAGSVVINVANTVHWDGNRAGQPPALIEIVGMGPMTTTMVHQ